MSCRKNLNKNKTNPQKSNLTVTSSTDVETHEKKLWLINCNMQSVNKNTLENATYLFARVDVFLINECQAGVENIKNQKMAPIGYTLLHGNTFDFYKTKESLVKI